MQLRSVLISAQVLIDSDLLGSEPGSGLHPGDPAAQGSHLDAVPRQPVMHRPQAFPFHFSLMTISILVRVAGP